MTAEEGEEMRAVLNQLNAVPGVMGSLICGADGKLLSQAFPPGVNPSTLLEAALVVAEGASGMETVTGPVHMMDFRYGDARLLARTVGGAHLLFLCSQAMNVQPLSISLAVAAPKLEKLLAARALAGPEGHQVSGSQLYQIAQRIDAVIKRRKLDPFKTRGQIALQAGFALALIDAETPDDPEKVSRLKAAASAVLGEPF
jgi:predicted regulator of Ras-like GTPase activity (Roadblock/LC7/MglB family)